MKNSKWSTPEYIVWNGMKKRCDDKRHVAYHRYGGRGISVCQEWYDFDVFMEDMGYRPFDGAQIDRINNNEGYCKTNCRWVTAKENARNKSNQLTVNYRGEDIMLSIIAENNNISYSNLYRRVIVKGMTIGDALNIPFNKVEPKKVVKKVASPSTKEVYMKRKEFAEHLKISRSTVDKLIKMDGFPLAKVVDQYRIPLNAAVKWMNEEARKDANL